MQFWLKSKISNCGSDTIFLGQRGQRQEWKWLFVITFSIIHFLLYSVDRSWPLGTEILSWAQVIWIHVLSRQRAQRWLILAPGKGPQHTGIIRGELALLGRVKTIIGTSWRCPLPLQSSDLKQSELKNPADCHNFTDAFWCSTVFSCPSELASSCSFSLKHFTVVVYSACHQRIMSYFANTDYAFQPYMKNNPSPTRERNIVLVPSLMH